MRTLLALAIMLPLACQADGSWVLGGDVWDGMIASRQAMEKKQPAPAQPTAKPHVQTDRERAAARRQAQETFDRARRENERRRQLGIQ